MRRLAARWWSLRPWASPRKNTSGDRQMKVLHAIRAATRPQHETLQARWDLVRGLLRLEGRRRIVRAIHEVHAPSEVVLLPWLTGLTDLDYEQRLKTPLLQADLRALGAPEPESAWSAAQLPQ